MTKVFSIAVCLEPDGVRDAMGSTLDLLVSRLHYDGNYIFFSSLALCNIQILTLV